MGQQLSTADVASGSPPTPLRRPASWRSHELEDLDKLSQAIFSESKNPEKWSEGSLHEASYIVHMLGTQLPQSFLDVRNDLGLMTLKGRLATFPEDWTGWSPLEMALLGLYVTPEEKVRCAVCDVTFRKLKTRDFCQVMRHKQLSPFCLQLRRYQCHSPKATPEGKRVRQNSTSALDDRGDAVARGLCNNM